jgi:hypothetical protein
MARKRRQKVTFTDDAAQLVADMAEKKGLTVSEVIRRGVALEAWLDENSEARILIQHPGEQAREIKFVG